jgi:hypothetical protein
VLTDVENNGNTRDTRVYTSSGLHEDKDPMSCVQWCIVIQWVETPYPSFYRLRELGLQGRSKSVIVLPNWDSISTCLFYKIYRMIIF